MERTKNENRQRAKKKNLNDEQKSERAQSGAHAFSCTGEITGLAPSACAVHEKHLHECIAS